MAYRALITIQSLHQITGEVENQCYATMHLGEEFKEGEEMAHCLASERTYPAACWLADGGIEQLCWRGVHWPALEDYRRVFADQQWVITFKRAMTRDDIEVTITGKDGLGEQIFFRRRVYSL
jgi:hypothetical protein